MIYVTHLQKQIKVFVPIIETSAKHFNDPRNTRTNTYLSSVTIIYYDGRINQYQ